MKELGLNSKSQTPNPKQIPSLKFQRSTVPADDALEFGIWSLFGFWFLGFGIFER
jgi:hypothetical protein